MQSYRSILEEWNNIRGHFLSNVDISTSINESKGGIYEVLINMENYKIRDLCPSERNVIFSFFLKVQNFYELASLKVIKTEDTDTEAMDVFYIKLK